MVNDLDRKSYTRYIHAKGLWWCSSFYHKVGCLKEGPQWLSPMISISVKLMKRGGTLFESSRLTDDK
jgi:hypothetical protein